MALGDHVGGVPGDRVPQDHQTEAVEPERHGPLDRVGGAVAGLADPDGLLGVEDRDLDRPSAGVPGDNVTAGLSRSVVTNAKS
ncbi:MAG: hypothetical protein ACRDYA_09180 [Egibacteraceae bacterium]